MNSKAFVWFNGKFINEKDAKVPLLTHGLHYGSGVFEGIRAYETPQGPAVFRLRDHVRRFFRSMAAFGMKIRFSEKDIERAILKVVAKNKFRSCYIRPIAFYGKGMTLHPNADDVIVAVAAWPWGAYLGENKALSLGVSPYIRFHPRSVVPGAKISGYYATSVLATQNARARGFDEALLLDHEGFIAEGPGENIFMVKHGKLFTPKSPSILPGITRASVMQIARDLRIPVAEKKILLKELLNADEVFLTGTATEIAAVGKINGRRIGNGAAGTLAMKIGTAYLRAVHGRIPRYKKWLTYAHLT